MDHLPKILGPKTLLPKIPCVCDPRDFDGQEFETFPLRKGFRLISQHEWPKFALNADGSRLSESAPHRLAQSWLFFGLMIEVLSVSGVSVEAEDFIECDGEDRFITTRALPGYLSEWERREDLLSMKDRKTHFRRQQQLSMVSSQFRLHQISGQWWQDTLLQWVERPKESYIIALPLAFQMSLTILCDTLDRASRRARGNLHSSSSEPLLQNQSLIDELTSRGWCPSEIAFILSGLDDSSAFFVSQLDRHRLEATHTKCSANKCLAFNVVTEQYTTKHTIDCHGCPNTVVDRQRLASILRRGQTPRARLKTSDFPTTSALDLEVEECGSYVAISHVWSDGLGNPKANSLPTCQVLRLHRMTAALNIKFTDEIPCIWIDSLLVPVDKGIEKKLALSQLCNYYQAAEKVLVLDSDLLEISRACSEEELAARILFSTWMRRLWTLEEGILSHDNLLFQLCDGTVSLSDLKAPSNLYDSVTTLGSHLVSNLHLYLPKLTFPHPSPAEKSPLQSRIFTQLLPALEYRSTTKAADEPLCIAHILRLDASRLVVLDDSQARMREMMVILAERDCLFPRGLLFTKEPKLQFDGFRWSPASFMAFEREDIDLLIKQDDNKYGRVVNEGLLVRGMGAFLLSFGSETFRKIIYAKVDKRIYALTPVPVGKTCADGTYWTAQSSNEALNVDIARQWTTDMQSLLGKSPITTAVLFDGAAAILVLIYKSRGQKGDPDGVLKYALIIGQLYMRPLKTATKNHFAAGANSDAIAFGQPPGYLDEVEREMREAFENIFDPDTSTFLRCNSIDPSQRWCIG